MKQKVDSQWALTSGVIADAQPSEILVSVIQLARCPDIFRPQQSGQTKVEMKKWSARRKNTKSIVSPARRIFQETEAQTYEKPEELNTMEAEMILVKQCD